MTSLQTCPSICFQSLPSLSQLSAYIRQVNLFPLLNPEEELSYVEDFKKNGSIQAIQALILSHLRLVVKIAQEHAGYGLPQEDLIQEGNVGLMRAVKKFDTLYGVRLAAYAAIWIKSEIQEYILSNWRMVKIGASKGLKKLFFNLRKLQEQLHGVPRLRQVEEIADLLKVEKSEVEKAMEWFSGGEIALEWNEEDESGQKNAVLFLPAPESQQPECQWEDREKASWQEKIKESMKELNDRERVILEQRFLKEEPATFVELSKDLSISKERVRQIEQSALKKIKKSLGFAE